VRPNIQTFIWGDWENTWETVGVFRVPAEIKAEHLSLAGHITAWANLLRFSVSNINISVPLSTERIIFMCLLFIAFNKRLSNHIPRITWRLLWRFSIPFPPLHVDSGRNLLAFYVLKILRVVSNLNMCCHYTQWDFRSVALHSMHICFSSHGYWKWKCEKKTATRCYCSKIFCSFWRGVFRSTSSNSWVKSVDSL